LIYVNLGALDAGIRCEMAAGKAAVPRRTLNDSIAVALISTSPFVSVSIQSRAPVTARCGFRKRDMRCAESPHYQASINSDFRDVPNESGADG
jgi:hypothetical protein